MCRRRIWPPGPSSPSLLQAARYTFDQPGFFAACRERYGPTWTLRLPGFPPGVVTTDRDAIRHLFSGDPLDKRHGNDLLRPILGERSLLLLEPAAHLARRRLELPAFHGDVVRGYRERIRGLVEAEVRTWSGEVETHERARKLTLAIIAELLFGVHDAALRDASPHWPASDRRHVRFMVPLCVVLAAFAVGSAIAWIVGCRRAGDS